MLTYQEIINKRTSFNGEMNAIRYKLIKEIVNKVKNNGGTIALEKPIALDSIFHYNGCDDLDTDLVVQISEYKGTIIVESYIDEMSYRYRDDSPLHHYQIKSLNLLTIDELSKIWDRIKAV